MSRRVGCRSLDNKKSGGSRSALTGIRRIGEAAFFQLHSQSGLCPEELAAGVWTIGKAEAANRKSRNVLMQKFFIKKETNGVKRSARFFVLFLPGTGTAGAGF